MSSAHVLCRRGLVLLGAAVVAAALAAPTKAVADDAAINERISAHLAVGEFGPARALAAALEGGARDRWFAEIARTQALVGARRASVNTAAGIFDDRARSGVLGDIGSMPFGTGARGGAAIADFDSLMELIQDTVGPPNTWEEKDAGPGTMKEFRGGVYVDASGVLHRMAVALDDGALSALRSDAATAGDNRDAFRTSALRKVSLTRLEKQAQLRAALGLPADESMAHLAGLHKIQYVFVYPETGDVVLAGPAGAWRENAEGRTVNVETGRPVLRLDDLVVLLRNASAEEGRFGCSITPRRENLERTQAYLKESTRTPLKPERRAAWLKEVRDQLGKQDITVDGLDPRTGVARVIVEADYHMKLIGMGLEEGTLGVKSYLASVTPGPDGSLPPMEVLRWWFTLNYEAITATDGRDAFAISGPGVQVLSENELLTKRGERVHTGKSDELNSEFARSFTKEFEALAVKYPVYAELQNVFDLALAAALIRSEDMPGQVSWHMTYFGTDEQSGGLVYQVSLGEAPKEVESVINHRVVDRSRIVAGVSGGVSVDTRGLVAQDAIQKDRYGLLPAERTGSAPKNLPADAWWWD